MPLVPAICTQCGAQIEVDNSHEAGICKHCGTAFITEKAINKYTTNITNHNNFAGANINIVSELEQLVSAAQGFQRLEEYDKALEIYETITEKYPQDARGWVGCISTYRNGEIIKGEPSEWWGLDFFEGNTMSRWFKNAGILADSKTMTNLENAKKTYTDAIKKKWDDFEKICSLQGLKDFIGNDVYVSEESNGGRLYVLNGTLYYEKPHFYSQEYEKWSYMIYKILSMDGSRTIHGEDCFPYTDNKDIIDMTLHHFDKSTIVFGGIFGRKYIKSNNDNARERIDYVWKDTKRLYDNHVAYEEYKAEQRRKAAKGCYIATCVYGSYDCPQVWTLRRFRDFSLDNTWYGRMFIKCYYAISPTLVKWFGNQKWFKIFWKMCLDSMVSKLNQQGIKDTQYMDKY